MAVILTNQGIQFSDGSQQNSSKPLLFHSYSSGIVSATSINFTGIPITAQKIVFGIKFETSTGPNNMDLRLRSGNTPYVLDVANILYYSYSSSSGSSMSLSASTTNFLWSNNTVYYQPRTVLLEVTRYYNGSIPVRFYSIKRYDTNGGITSSGATARVSGTVQSSASAAIDNILLSASYPLVNVDAFVQYEIADYRVTS